MRRPRKVLFKNVIFLIELITDLSGGQLKLDSMNVSSEF